MAVNNSSILADEGEGYSIMRSMNLRLVTQIVVLCCTALPIASQQREILAVAKTLSDTLSAPPTRTVAVADFTNLDEQVTELGKYMSEELESALVSTGTGVDVVDRSHLKAILREHKLGADGHLDPDTVQQLGKFAGVKILIVGTLTPLGDNIHFTIKALDTLDARVVNVATGDLPKTPAIESLLNKESLQNSTNPARTVPAIQKLLLAPSSTQEEQEKISFTFDSCSHHGSSIVCRMTITNLAEDRDVTLYVGKCYSGLPRIIVEGGSEILADSVTLGSKTSACGPLEGRLVSGLPTRVEVRFSQAADVNSIALFEIEGSVHDHSGSDPRFRIPFHAIPMSSRN